MHRSTLITGLALLGTLAVFAAAEPLQQASDHKARKLSNVSWCQIRQVDFKPGKRDAALKIIREKFQPASESAGLPPAQVFEYATGGSWDIQMIFAMPDGPSELEWDVHPDDEKWMTALASHCGGADKADALIAEYRDLISSGDSQIAFQRNGSTSAK
jgi:hypothetical protein